MIHLQNKKVLIGISAGINSAAILCHLKESGIIPSELHLFYAHFIEHSPDSFQFVADLVRFARKHFPNVFFRYVWNKADSIMFIAKRIRFLDANGKKQGNAGAPSVLIAYGKNNVDALEESGIPGKHLHLTYTPMIIVGISPTWVSVVTIAVNNFGDNEMKPLYEMVERIAPDKVAKNKHWREKVRQSLQIIRKKKASEQIIQLN